MLSKKVTHATLQMEHDLNGDTSKRLERRLVSWEKKNKINCILKYFYFFRRWCRIARLVTNRHVRATRRIRVLRLSACLRLWHYWPITCPVGGQSVATCHFLRGIFTSNVRATSTCCTLLTAGWLAGCQYPRHKSCHCMLQLSSVWQWVGTNRSVACHIAVEYWI